MRLIISPSTAFSTPTLVMSSATLSRDFWPAEVGTRGPATAVGNRGFASKGTANGLVDEQGEAAEDHESAQDANRYPGPAKSKLHKPEDGQPTPDDRPDPPKLRAARAGYAGPARSCWHSRRQLCQPPPRPVTTLRWWCSPAPLPWVMRLGTHSLHTRRFVWLAPSISPICTACLPYSRHPEAEG
jgi:hypothetical protein